MRRRFVYDPSHDRVVEIEVRDRTALNPAERYEQMLAGYREKRNDRSGAAEKAGQELRVAALERAERREFAHRRFLDERRWKET
jgi:hypothetical protein